MKPPCRGEGRIVKGPQGVINFRQVLTPPTPARKKEGSAKFVAADAKKKPRTRKEGGKGGGPRGFYIEGWG